MPESIRYAPAALLPFQSEGDIGPPRRSVPCECEPAPPDVPAAHFYQDPHPGGWCRTCGRVVANRPRPEDARG